jgi:hypothetical protein
MGDELDGRSIPAGAYGSVDAPLVLGTNAVVHSEARTRTMATSLMRTSPREQGATMHKNPGNVGLMDAPRSRQRGQLFDSL